MKVKLGDTVRIGNEMYVLDTDEKVRSYELITAKAKTGLIPHTAGSDRCICGMPRHDEMNLCHRRKRRNSYPRKMA